MRSLKLQDLQALNKFQKERHNWFTSIDLKDAQSYFHLFPPQKVVYQIPRGYMYLCLCFGSSLSLQLFVWCTEAEEVLGQPLGNVSDTNGAGSQSNCSGIVSGLSVIHSLYFQSVSHIGMH